MGLFKRDLSIALNPTRKGLRVMRTWAFKGKLFNTNLKKLDLFMGKRRRNSLFHYNDFYLVILVIKVNKTISRLH